RHLHALTDFFVGVAVIEAQVVGEEVQTRVLELVPDSLVLVQADVETPFPERFPNGRIPAAAESATAPRSSARRPTRSCTRDPTRRTTRGTALPRAGLPGPWPGAAGAGHLHARRAKLRLDGLGH